MQSGKCILHDTGLIPRVALSDIPTPLARHFKNCPFCADSLSLSRIFQTAKPGIKFKKYLSRIRLSTECIDKKEKIVKEREAIEILLGLLEKTRK